jgi:hypothetical protein
MISFRHLQEPIMQLLGCKEKQSLTLGAYHLYREGRHANWAEWSFVIETAGEQELVEAHGRRK